MAFQLASSHTESAAMSQSQMLMDEPSKAKRTRSRSEASSAMARSSATRRRRSMARTTPSRIAATGRIASRNASTQGMDRLDTLA